jgi:perosamine synthetase
MVVTNCDRLASNIRQSLGDAGFDYQISPMQAALGVAQLERIDDLVARKRQIAAWYRQSLMGLAGVRFSVPTSGSTCVPSEVTIAFDSTTNLTSAIVVDDAASHGIECQPMFRPASSLEVYDGLVQARVARSRNRVSYDLSQRGVSLPSGANLSRRQIEDVAAAVRNLVARHSDVRPHWRNAA